MNSQAEHVLNHIESEIRLLVLKKSQCNGIEREAYDFCLNRLYIVLRKENDLIQAQDGANEVDHEMRDVRLAVNNKLSEMSLIKYS